MTTTNLKKQFAGKVAVVTGGTQGLGETVARLLAARGAAGIVICGRNAKRGKEVAASLNKAGTKTVFVKADLGQIADCRKVIAAADRKFGKVDVLVNVAASTDRGTILDTSPELFDSMFALNVRAPFFLIQDAARIMRREGIEGTCRQHPFDVRAWRPAVHRGLFRLEGRAAGADQERRLRADAGPHPPQRP